MVPPRLDAAVQMLSATERLIVGKDSAEKQDITAQLASLKNRPQRQRIRTRCGKSGDM